MQEVGTKAPGPSSIFSKKLAQINTAAEEEADCAVNLTADKRVKFQVYLSDVEIEPTTWNIADMDRVVNQLVTEIYGITSNNHMQFTKEFGTSLVEFEVWWHPIGIQELQKTIEQHVIYFGYPKMNLVSHISEPIC